MEPTTEAQSIGNAVDKMLDREKAARTSTAPNRTRQPAKPRTPKAPTARQADAAAKRAQHTAEKPAPESIEFKTARTLPRMTHRENCVMVTLGGNKVKWTSKDHREFKFNSGKDGLTEEADLIQGMMNFGIATVKTGPAVLASLKEKGLLEQDEKGEGIQWTMTPLGKSVAEALNNKVWK